MWEILLLFLAFREQKKQLQIYEKNIWTILHNMQVKNEAPNDFLKPNEKRKVEYITSVRPYFSKCFKFSTLSSNSWNYRYLRIRSLKLFTKEDWGLTIYISQLYGLIAIFNKKTPLKNKTFDIIDSKIFWYFTIQHLRRVRWWNRRYSFCLYF